MTFYLKIDHFLVNVAGLPCIMITGDQGVDTCRCTYVMPVDLVRPFYI